MAFLKALSQITPLIALSLLIGCTKPNDLPYTDKFDSGFKSSWEVFDHTEKESKWDVDSGKYRQTRDVGSISNDGAFDEIYHLGTYATLSGGEELTNYLFEIDMSIESEKGDECGIMWRVQNNDNFYRLTISYRDGFTLLQKKTNGNWSTLAKNTRGLKPSDSVHLQVWAEDSNISIEQDGQHLFSVADASLAKGTVGLYGRNRCTFDNLSLSLPNNDPRIAILTPSSFNSVTALDTKVTGIVHNQTPNSTVAVSIATNPCVVQMAADNKFEALCSVPTPGTYTIQTELSQASQIIDSIDVKDIVFGGITMATLGDSITNGKGDNYQADGISKSHRRIAYGGFQSNLEDLLAIADPSSQVVIYNGGIAGDWTAWLNSRVASFLEQYMDADTVLLMTGTNDVINKLPSGLGCDGETCRGTFKAELQEAIDKLTAGGKTVWLAQIPPIWGEAKFTRNANPGPDPRNTLVREYNQVISTQITGVEQGPDFYSYFLGKKDRGFLFADSYHPNGLGYRAFAALWRNALLNLDRYPYVADDLSVVIDGQPLDPTYYQQTLLENGDSYFVDNDSKLIAIPQHLQEANWILTADAHRFASAPNYLSIELGSRAVDVYVVFPQSQKQPPAWLENWTPTNEIVSTTHPHASEMRVYFKKGLNGRLQIGGAAGAASNYIVAIRAANKPS